MNMRGFVQRGMWIVIGLMPMILAYCPNECSNKGSCGDYDICTCINDNDGNPAWTGPDCSLRTCPRATAWIGDVAGANNMHPMVECSNKGECERGSGRCLCYKGFEGSACERSVCPKSCQANGVCFSQGDLADEAGRDYSIPWDAYKMYGCVCDIGFRGIDCSWLECPSGLDPRGGYGNESGRECSGRGLCDYEKGQCKCFFGYFGVACDRMAVAVM